ncbi:MAG TPA: cytochrome c peroxidase [Polyangiales bacterium]|nr:cytochrome c peroxidase [Polyangiales bacterium]
MRLGCWVLVLSACTQPVIDPPVAQVFATPFSSQAAPSDPDNALAPLPQRIDLDRAKVALGRRLFDDARLSGDAKVACRDCHSFQHAGALAQARSKLPDRPPVPVNVPSLLNASFNFRFGWAGRFIDIGQQLDAAMESRAAMAGSWQRAIDALGRDPQLVSEFRASYPAGLTAGSLREVLALFCLSLVTPNSRLDRQLRGELQLTAAEQHGYDLFRSYGCISCHQGINVGGNLLQRLGIMGDYFAVRGNPEPADAGLFAVTKDPEDLHVFRVPSLRNVAKTAPYFHDGSVDTLEEAVREMAHYQLGRTLEPDETGALVAFLETLTGELEGRAL